MNKLKDISSDNKENIIDAIGVKQNLLENILKKYKEIREKYVEYDEFYRVKLFDFYKNEYDDIIIDILKKKIFINRY